jgi:transcriptional regulator with XRE-family HTH domain
MPKKYSQLREDLAERVGEERLEQARRDADEEVEQYERTLRELRRAFDMTQSELAHRLKTSQAEVSRLERRRDMLVSTLSRYVAAVGGRLEINAVFDDHEVVVPLHTGAEVGPIADSEPVALERLGETLNSIIDSDADRQRRGTSRCVQWLATETFPMGSFSRGTRVEPSDDVDLIVECKGHTKSSAETLDQIRTYLKGFESLKTLEGYPVKPPSVLFFAPIIAAIPARQPLAIQAHAVRLAMARRNASPHSREGTWCGIAIPTAMRAGDDDHPPEIDWRSHEDPDETFTARLEDVELIACSDD